MQTAFRSCSDLATALGKGKLSALELLELYLERIERLNPAINAVVAFDAERARKKARDADAATTRGESRGPLHGIPMTIKDTYEVAGMTATAGSPNLKNHKPERNAAAVQSLIDAGAIIFGKTNVPLFANDIQTYNKVYGTTNNPWNIERTPGGSSGGSAAALAAGFTPLELGSDIGGSIRNPAHFCGVYGHKTSFGIIPMRGHIPPLPGKPAAFDLGVAGPLARHVDDLDLALSILAGPSEHEKPAWRLDLPPARQTELRNFRVAVWLNDETFPIDSSVGGILQNTVDAIAKTGAQVDGTARPIDDMAASYENYLQSLYAVMGPSLPETLVAYHAERARTLDEDDQSHGARFTRGITQSHGDWVKADEHRRGLRAQWAEFFRNFDVLLCPAMPTAAFPHDQSPDMAARTNIINGEARPYLDQLGWAALAGVVYLPATVAPVGLTKDNLPVGMQIIAPYLEDRTAIHFARLLANVAAGFTPPPGY